MHKAANNEAWEAYRRAHASGYIEDQNALRDFRYGHRTFKGLTGRTVGMNAVDKEGAISGRANTCQAVAVFNALLFMSQGRLKINMSDVLEYFETRGVVMNACMGTSPKAAVRFLKEAGYNARLFYAGDISPQRYKEIGERYDCFIFGAYNAPRGISCGLHVMCVTKEEKGFAVHNSQDGLTGSVYSSLESAVKDYRGGDSRPVFVTAIGYRKTA